MLQNGPISARTPFNQPRPVQIPIGRPVSDISDNSPQFQPKFSNIQPVKNISEENKPEDRLE